MAEIITIPSFLRINLNQTPDSRGWWKICSLPLQLLPSPPLPPHLSVQEFPGRQGWRDIHHGPGSLALSNSQWDAHCLVPPGLLTAASAHGDVGRFRKPQLPTFSASTRQYPLRSHCLPRAAPSRGAGTSSLLTGWRPSNPFLDWDTSFFFPLLPPKPFHQVPPSFTLPLLSKSLRKGKVKALAPGLKRRKESFRMNRRS